MPRPTAGRALFYTRESDDRVECAPPQEVRWAIGQARDLGLRFTGTEAAIEGMMKTGRPASGDLFLDYGISGNVVDRPGLRALQQAAEADLAVSHIIIPRRDRLIRPDNPLDGLRIETDLRQKGLTIVFRGFVLAPVRRGQRINLAELMLGLFEYEESGKFRRQLAEKVLLALPRLAEQGVSIGGSPPYGFERWLATADGTRVRKLPPGERVKRVGHHVLWWPTAEAELAVVDRMQQLVVGLPVSKIADLLTAEGVPPPSAGHRGAGGVWYPTTVRDILRNSIYVGVREYGKRSEGDQHRFTPAGPRDLTDADFGEHGKPRAVVNPPAERIRKELTFAPPTAPVRFAEVQNVLDARAATQQGKKRARGGAANPLGCRVFDLDCGWPMYRLSRNGTFKYTCGLYQQSDSKYCRHNTLPGPAAAEFVLNCVRQRVLVPGLLDRLRDRLRELAEAELGADRRDADQRALRDELAKVTRDLGVVQRNLARAATDAQWQAIQAEFDKLHATQKDLEQRLAAATQPQPADRGVEQEVEAALAGLDRFDDLAKSADAQQAIAELFGRLNARMFVQFRELPRGRQKVNELVGGVLTFGSAPPPVPLYEGPTDRRVIRKRVADGEVDSLLAGSAASPGGGPQDGPEDESSGNVGRRTRRCT